jgi:hypothetical protein
MPTANALSALVHDRLGQTLRDVFARAGTGNPGSLFEIRLEQNDTLVRQLEDGSDGPPRVTLGFALGIIGNAVPALPELGGQNRLDPGDLVRRLQSAVRERMVFFGRLRDEVTGLVEADDPVNIRSAGEALFRKIDEAFPDKKRDDVFDSLGQWGRLQPFIGGDVGTVLPFATIVTAVQGNVRNVLRIPQSIERGLLDYFFRPDGYRALDGARIVAPLHLADVGRAAAGALGTGGIAGGLDQLRDVFSKTTAEHYIRDTIRVIVESAYDAGRGVSDLYQDVAGKLKNRAPEGPRREAVERKFVAWLRGFSAMSESATMRGVEVATQGVSQFQTNPLIAAAAGAFAGTVARKLAQDSFLGAVSAELARA